MQPGYEIGDYSAHRRSPRPRRTRLADHLEQKIDAPLWLIGTDQLHQPRLQYEHKGSVVRIEQPLPFWSIAGTSAATR